MMIKSGHLTFPSPQMCICFFVVRCSDYFEVHSSLLWTEGSHCETESQKVVFLSDCSFIPIDQPLHSSNLRKLCTVYMTAQCKCHRSGNATNSCQSARGRRSWITSMQWRATSKKDQQTPHTSSKRDEFQNEAE